MQIAKKHILKFSLSFPHNFFSFCFASINSYLKSLLFKISPAQKMESDIIYYNPDAYLETISGNKLSKKSLIRGSDQIQPSGKAIMQEGSIIRGDLAKIKMGKYVILCEKVTLRPTFKKIKG